MTGGAQHSIPEAGAGVGLKAPHYAEALSGDHGLDFFEVHAENYMGAGGPPHRWLTAFAEKYPLSFHGVCLSLGGHDALDAQHLERLADLVDRYQPTLVSEHVAWSSYNGQFLNDLLPPPFTLQSLTRLCEHVDAVQSRLKRRILLENPSQYLAWSCSDMPEADFLNAAARRTGCGILLDINNVYVSCENLGLDADAFIDAVDADAVCEIHLAGHAVDHYGGVRLLVDNHGGQTDKNVIQLFERFVQRAGPRPTLVEWDTDIPAFEVLASEALKMREIARSTSSLNGVKRAAC